MKEFKISIYTEAIRRVKQNYIKKSRKDFTDHYLYIINIVVWQQSIDKRYTRDSFVPVGFERCRKIVSQRELRPMLKDLISWGILETDNQYIVGMKAKGYRVCEECRGKIQQITIKDKLIIEKINKHRDGVNTDLALKGLGDLVRSLHSIRIDEDRAVKYIRNHYNIGSEEYAQRFVSIKNIAAGNFFMTRDSQGRVHTNLTSLGADVRQFLMTEDGEVFDEVDIANSQPLFFYCALSKADTIDRKELDDYRSIVLSGSFYETLNTLGMDRAAFKKMFYQDVLFGKNKSWTGKVSQIFQERWPSIYKFVVKQKEKDHNRIAIMLQKEESNFIINICCKEFLQRTGYQFVGTIHDSLLVLSNHGEIAKAVMIDMFDKHYGFVPTIKLK